MATLSDAEVTARSKLVAAEYAGILPYCEAFYIDAVMFAAERAVDAFDNFEICLTETIDPSVTFGLLQEALAHSAAISRFFWPAAKSGKLAAARGKKLREGFALTDTSPLKSRSLRNALEHFDENLDRYLLGDVVGSVFPRPIVESASRFTDEAIGHIFKLIDPTEGICVLLGERFEYRSIRSEVHSILISADEMDRTGGRLKSSIAEQ